MFVYDTPAKETRLPISGKYFSQVHYLWVRLEPCQVEQPYTVLIYEHTEIEYETRLILLVGGKHSSLMPNLTLVALKRPYSEA